MATTSIINSLTTRIVFAVALILMLAGALIGWALFRSVRQSVQEELNSQLNQRMAWLHASVEWDEGKLEFEAKAPLSAVARNWTVVTADGKVLWAAPGFESMPFDDPSFALKSKMIELGDHNGPALPASDIQLALPENTTRMASYSTGDKRGKLLLILSVREPLAHSKAELRRVALALWTIGPVSIVALVAILALFIRWQHAPLNSMSMQAALISPQNTECRIGPVGGSVELVRLRDAINSMVSRLAEGMLRERQFASMAAHELRTPLTQMRLNTEIALSKDRGASEYKEALTQALTDIERLQNLVANLLFLTRDHQGVEMRREVSLKTAVEQAAKSCGSDVRIRSDFSTITVLGNAELIQCALRNVLENARRYAPGVPAELALSVAPKTIGLDVTDSGPGIPAKDRERIFEPLTRLDEARTIGDETDGFGLGLTVARNAMRACGGELICKPRPDGKQGAAFAFTFQRAEE